MQQKSCALKCRILSEMNELLECIHFKCTQGVLSLTTIHLFSVLLKDFNFCRNIISVHHNICPTDKLTVFLAPISVAKILLALCMHNITNSFVILQLIMQCMGILTLKTTLINELDISPTFHIKYYFLVTVLMCLRGCT